MDKSKVSEVYRLTAMQQGMLFHTLDAPEPGVYIEQVSRGIERPDPAVWEAAWNRVIAQHDILRSGFYWEGLEQPLQFVLREARAELKVVDLSDLTDTERDAQVERLRHTDRITPFDLKQPPLTRLLLIHLSPAHSLFVWTYHHVLLDGWSAFLVIDQVYGVYRALCEGREPELAAAPQFKNYVRWLAAQDGAQAHAFWSEYLAGFSAPTPLGLVETTSTAGSSRYITLRHRLDDALAEALRQSARRLRITLSTLFQGAWATLLATYSGEDDVVFGSTVAGRPTDLVGADAMVGLFINTLPARARIERQASVADWLARLQTSLAQTRHYEHCALVDVQGASRVPRGLPLFESMVAVESFPSSRHIELPDVGMTQQTNYPLTLVVEPNRRMTLKAMFDAARFPARNVQRLLEQWTAVLQQFATDPQQPLGAVSLLDAAELEQQARWNATGRDYPQALGMQRWFERQAAATPQHVAVAAGDERLTYGELNQASNRLAHWLRRQGVRPGGQVAMLFEPSVEMIVALVAIVKAGCAYAPLDPQAPPARLAGMLADLQFEALLSHRDLAAKLDGYSGRVLDLDAAAQALAAESEADPEWPIETRDPLYVIHTSGSTGKPKAAAVLHFSFVNFMHYWVGEFGFDAADKVLLVNKVTFDLAQKNIWGALLTGGELHLNPAEHFEPAAVQSLVAERGITWINCTPSMGYALAEDPDFDAARLTSMRYLFLGGEPVHKQRLRHWLLAPGCRTELVNTYGPTECTDLCSVHRFARSELDEDLARPVTVGKALPNIRLYVLDRCGNRLPAGVCGEVTIGGVSVGSGYMNNAGLSAEKFVPDVFADELGARLYRTGDQGYFQNDGSVVVRGRVDFQVKLRGYRVELEEIDACLRRHAAVRDAATIVQGEAQRLVSYVVLKHEQSLDADLKAALKAHLVSLLPDYMVSSVFMALEALPLNDNGKVNRAALPEPPEEAVQGDAGPVAPRNDTEHKLASIWCQVLKRDSVGVTDNFFELGGHSLSITQVFSRIPKAFGVQLPLSLLFERPTIVEQAAAIDAAAQGPAPKSAGASDAATPRAQPRPETLPLSFAQSRLWFLHQYDSASVAYNVPNAVFFEQALDASHVQAALDLLTRRHESLRTCFPVVDGVPSQRIHDSAPVLLPVDDLGALDEPACRDEMQRIAMQEALHRFDLERGPLARYRMVLLGEQGSVLLATMHHIVTDGWSMDIFTRELREACAALASGQRPTWPALPLQYADYALWQRGDLQGEKLDRELDYWRKTLEGAADTIALPYDRARPETLDYQGGLVEQRLEPELMAALKRLGEANGATLFMTLLAGFAALLQRLSGQDDFNLGTPIANRHRQECEGLIGFFVNTLVLRLRPDGTRSFRDLLSQVGASTRSAYDHQELPFELLVDELKPERQSGLSPFFQVMFALQTAYEDTSLLSRDQWVARFDLQLTCHEGADGLAANWEYRASLFERETVEHMAELFARVLRQLVLHPDMPLERLLLGELDALQRDELAWNETARRYPAQVRIAELFEVQAAARPQAIAAVCRGERMSYAELNARANRLGHLLHTRGVREGTPVGVSLPRGHDLLVALLAILKAGGAYVPLDPSYPAERLTYMAQDSGIELLLADRQTAGWCTSVSNVCLDDAATLSTLAECSVENLQTDISRPTDEQLAYISYTSGTSGRPKGVAVPQRAVVRLVRDTNYCPLDETTVMLQCSPVAFDASTFEIWGALLNGGCVAVYPDAVVDVDALHALVEREAANTAFLTTALFNQWVRQLDRPTGLRVLLSGGEAASPHAVARLHEIDSRVQFANVYGPTENTTFSSFHPVARGFDATLALPIGAPIANTRLHVLDAALQPLPPGAMGELYCAGDGLALGYWGRPELTAEKFCADPFSSTGGRLYRTGDRVRRRRDGGIDFLGRVDQQVKIRGHRIEPAEVEALLRQHPEVASAAVVVCDSETLGKQLAAYFVTRAGSDLDASALRQFARQQLPGYLVPHHFMALDVLPLNDNGKVDRARLPAPQAERAQRQSVPPAGALESELWELWAELLGTRDFGVTDDFFELGGHSLLAAQVAARVRQQTGASLPLQLFFSQPTVRGLAQALELAQWTAAPRPQDHMDMDMEAEEEAGVL